MLSETYHECMNILGQWNQPKLVLIMLLSENNEPWINKNVLWDEIIFDRFSKMIISEVLTPK